MKPYAKAILAALIAGLGAASAGYVDGHLTAPELVAAVSAALVALGGVFAIPNSPPTPSDEDVLTNLDVKNGL